MATTYAFRCAHFGKYMKQEDIRQNCKYHQGEYQITVHSIEDYMH